MLTIQSIPNRSWHGPGTSRRVPLRQPPRAVDAALDTVGLHDHADPTDRVVGARAILGLPELRERPPRTSSRSSRSSRP